MQHPKNFRSHRFIPCMHTVCTFRCTKISFSPDTSVRLSPTQTFLPQIAREFSRTSLNNLLAKAISYTLALPSPCEKGICLYKKQIFTFLMLMRWN